MIKLSFCLRRRPELTREQFQAYWFDEHAPLVAKHSEALGIRRYVQTHALPEEASAALRASRGAPEPYDGVAELWFDSLDDLVAKGATDAARAAGQALLEDERRFIDLERSPLWFSQERVIVG